MTDLPAHIESLLANFVIGRDPNQTNAKLRTILAAAWGVLWEWDWDVSVGDDLSAAMEKLKEAMSDDFLAEQPCQRCGGGGVWYRDEVDPESGAAVERSDFCPDCQGGAS